MENSLSVSGTGSDCLSVVEESTESATNSQRNSQVFSSPERQRDNNEDVTPGVQAEASSEAVENGSEKASSNVSSPRRGMSPDASEPVLSEDSVDSPPVSAQCGSRCTWMQPVIEMYQYTIYFVFSLLIPSLYSA